MNPKRNDVKLGQINLFVIVVDIVHPIISLGLDEMIVPTRSLGPSLLSIRRLESSTRPGASELGMCLRGVPLRGDWGDGGGGHFRWILLKSNLLWLCLQMSLSIKCPTTRGQHCAVNSKQFTQLHKNQAVAVEHIH